MFFQFIESLPCQFMVLAVPDHAFYHHDAIANALIALTILLWSPHDRPVNFAALHTRSPFTLMSTSYHGAVDGQFIHVDS
jgi:hypothetical protein